MLKGETSSGFAFEIPDSRRNSMELLDALSAMDQGDGAQLSTVLNLLFTKEQKKALYEHLRTPEGNVPIDKVGQELKEMFSASAQGKNF